MNKKAKLKIEVFVPLGSCVCEFAPFMEKISNVTSKFKDLVEVQTKSIKSVEASKYGVQEICAVVDGKVKLSLNFAEKDLEDAISKCSAQAP